MASALAVLVMYSQCSAGEAVETMGRSEESKRNARPTAALGIEAVTPREKN
jgi:hypothetical protein